MEKILEDIKNSGPIYENSKGIGYVITETQLDALKAVAQQTAPLVAVGDNSRQRKLKMMLSILSSAISDSPESGLRDVCLMVKKDLEALIAGQVAEQINRHPKITG